jgi:hypothetical protein
VGVLQIQLGRDKVADPATDSLGRSRVGSHPGMTPKEAWEAGRGAWVFKADRVLEQDEVQIVDLEGTVLAVARIKGVVKAGDRYAIEGDLLPHDPRIGKPTTTPHRSRNSVGYF